MRPAEIPLLQQGTGGGLTTLRLYHRTGRQSSADPTPHFTSFTGLFHSGLNLFLFFFFFFFKKRISSQHFPPSFRRFHYPPLLFPLLKQEEGGIASSEWRRLSSESSSAAPKTLFWRLILWLPQCLFLPLLLCQFDALVSSSPEQRMPSSCFKRPWMVNTIYAPSR